MPAASNFRDIVEPEWQAIVAYVHGLSAMPPWEDIPLTWITTTPARPIYGEVVGGNLSLWASLAGTPLELRVGGMLLHHGEQWSGLITFGGVNRSAGLEKIAAAFGRAGSDHFVLPFADVGELGALLTGLGDAVRADDTA